MATRRHSRITSRLASISDALAHNLWLVPLVGVVGAAVLSAALRTVDERLSADATAWYLFRGGPEGARSVLTAVASSIMTFTGVVFSVTVLVLQLATQQFSPRVLRTLIGDRWMQVSLATFVGTFVYALLTLRSVRGASDHVEAFVPSLSVWFAVALATVCVVTFVYFIHHVAQSIRAVNILARAGDETRAAIERLYPEDIGEAADEDAVLRPAGEPALLVLHRGRSGVLRSVAEAALGEAAGQRGTVMLKPMVGDFVPEGSVLFEIWGDAAEIDPESLAAALDIGRERTIHQDPAFGIRGIVDVAERALSPGVNDPTTAVQALDELHDLLRMLARRRMPAPVRTTARGGRLILPRPDFHAYVRLALDEIRHYGKSSVQVVRRLRFLIEDVLAVAPPDRRAELLRQLQRLDEARQDARDAAADPALLGRGSAQGHGP